MLNKKHLIILGIETSCDETSTAVVEIKKSKNRLDFFVLANQINSQIKIHQPYGGVVPELAGRQHLKNILPLLEMTLKQAEIKLDQIDLIAVVNRPGLITSLLVGIETAKTLAYARGKPLTAINHLKAHIYANWLENAAKIEFPALGLIVSGGHTELVLMKNQFNFENIGQTMDDAAGEAFDKIAKMLEIGYPGGPIIEKLASQGNPEKFNFPRAMINSKDFNFSFSGLKTAVLYFIRDNFTSHKQLAIGDKQLADICASVQQAITDVLTIKTIKAAKKYNVKTILLAGGVAANQSLRQEFNSKLKIQNSKLDFRVPPKNLCTDNAAMVAAAGYFAYLKKDLTTWDKIKVKNN